MNVVAHRVTLMPSITPDGCTASSAGQGEDEPALACAGRRQVQRLGGEGAPSRVSGESTIACMPVITQRSWPRISAACQVPLLSLNSANFGDFGNSAVVDLRGGRLGWRHAFALSYFPRGVHGVQAWLFHAAPAADDGCSRRAGWGGAVLAGWVGGRCASGWAGA